MKIDELLANGRDAITVRRVFADPYERDGVTIIPAAAVRGGGGGGQGSSETQGTGEGGGFGMAARPVGVYVLAEGQVRWRPAVDVNRLVASLAAVAVVFLLTRSRNKRARLKASAAAAGHSGG